MNIFRGMVVTKRDGTKKGLLTVVPNGTSVDLTKPVPADSTVDVFYVSPYIGGANSGRVEIPEANTQILYCSVENDIPIKPDYYYLGSVFNQEYEIVQRGNAHKQGDPRPGSPADSEDFSFSDQSMTYGIKTPEQKEIVIQEGRSPTTDSKRVKIQSSRKHGLFLDDSSETQKVNLKSGFQGAGLELRDEEGDKDPSKGPDSANLYAKGNLQIRSWEGGMKIDLVDGNNLDILNNSRGSKTSGSVNKRQAEFGNMTIHTDRGDVLIRSGGNGVFIDCYGNDPVSDNTLPYASFQVRSQNRIHLYASNGIDLKSSGDINIDGKNVNIKGDTIQLNPTFSVSDKMSIRKTNDEILAEETTSSPAMFFTEDSNFDSNYSEGRNTGGNLT